MLKIASKLVLPALIAVMLAAVLPVVAAVAAPGDVKDLTEGCWTDEHRWIVFGEYNGKPLIWRVLEVGKADDGSPTAFLLAESKVDWMAFDRDSNDWAGSDIKKRLNDEFYRAAFSNAEREAILTSIYRYGEKNEDSDRETASKIFLLSVDEAKDSRFFADDEDRDIGHIGQWWWLRSPVRYIGNAAFVFSDGKVYDGDYETHHSSVRFTRLVRPALKINLSSPIFTSSASASEYEILYGVKVNVRDADNLSIMGAEVAADSPPQTYFTGRGGEVEMKLGTGRHKIQVSAEGYEAKEIEFDVEPGGNNITVDMEKEK